MDSMCDQLEVAKHESEALITALEQLRHADRVATIGRLVSSVAHELGNPLNVIELRAQLIASDEVTLPLAKQGALAIVEQTRRMTRSIDEILSFVRVRPPKIARIDLRSVLRQSVALCEHVSKQHGASIVLEVPRHPIAIEGDADKLLQVVVNLVVNGAQAMPDGGLLRVSTEIVRHTPLNDPEGPLREHACIEVSDQGTGMSPETLAKVFRPFFSTRGAEGGTGLGLSVAQGIANDHEGWISASSELGRGSSFKVYLPTLAQTEVPDVDYAGR
jgi:signal transduction histidine kinase